MQVKRGDTRRFLNLARNQFYACRLYELTCLVKVKDACKFTWAFQKAMEALSAIARGNIVCQSPPQRPLQQQQESKPTWRRPNTVHFLKVHCITVKSIKYHLNTYIKVLLCLTKEIAGINDSLIQHLKKRIQSESYPFVFSKVTLAIWRTHGAFEISFNSTGAPYPTLSW